MSERFYLTTPIYYPNAEPARLDLGSATRSGLWSPAPLRLS